MEVLLYIASFISETNSVLLHCISLIGIVTLHINISSTSTSYNIKMLLTCYASVIRITVIWYIIIPDSICLIHHFTSHTLSTFCWYNYFTSNGALCYIAVLLTVWQSSSMHNNGTLNLRQLIWMKAPFSFIIVMIIFIIYSCAFHTVRCEKGPSVSLTRFTCLGGATRTLIIKISTWSSASSNNSQQSSDPHWTKVHSARINYLLPNAPVCAEPFKCELLVPPMTIL